MMNFCTLFDSYYIHKGLALYESLCECTEDFHLFIVAFDDASYNKLKEIGLEKATIISLAEFETPDLLRVKPSRNKAEYCWTCSSAVTEYCMQKYNLDAITYLDSDLMFLSDPKVIEEEIGDKEIGITEHFNSIPVTGRFCVQYMYFKNQEEGRQALKWWKDKCIEWCYARQEDGKYGDQAYVDAFPQRYESLCIIKNRGVGIADWNVNQYDISDDNRIIYKGIAYPKVFYHFHGTSINYKKGLLIMILHINEEVSDSVIKTFYEPYLILMSKIFNKYLGKEVQGIRIIKKGKIANIYSKIKSRFRNNVILNFLYHSILRIKYNGYEKSKI